MKLAIMHIFLTTHQEEDYQAFCKSFNNVLNYGAKEYSLSPMREDGPYGEIYVTLQIDESHIQDLLKYMSSGWDGPEDDCECFAFNAKLFDNHIYSLYFQIPD